MSSSSANMTADDYIDYLYDDAEDFASNVDYTAPESYAYLGEIYNNQLIILICNNQSLHSDKF